MSYNVVDKAFYNSFCLHAWGVHYVIHNACDLRVASGYGLFGCHVNQECTCMVVHAFVVCYQYFIYCFLLVSSRGYH